MSTKSLILSSSGLKNLVSGASLEEEFSFIFSGQNIKMKTFFAEFISPKISKLHYSDPTINSICLTDYNSCNKLSESVLTKFQLLSCGESIEITQEESFQMKIISILLDNKDLYNKLVDLYTNEINETNLEQYLTNLSILSNISPAFDCFNYNNIIDFVSSHFYSIDKMKLKNLPKTIIYSIISNQNLKIKSEDSLFDFINELFENDEEKDFDIISFYEEIEFKNLSQKKLDYFTDLLNPSSITRSLWEKLRPCLRIQKNRPNNNSKQNRYKYENLITCNIEYDENKSHALCGIIDHLMKESGGNVSDNGTVKVTSSKVNPHNPDRIARNAVDIHNNKKYFQSADEENSWLKYDFIEKKVHPTRYSIQTRYDDDGTHPRSWVIEGSNSDADYDWEIIDNRQNDTSLKGKSTVCTFNIQEYEGSYRYLRIRQTGKNSRNTFYLTIGSLEYFGTLFQNQ